MIAALGLLTAISGQRLQAAETSAKTPVAATQNPAWLSESSLSVKESYDDNVYLVSGRGAAEQTAWVTTLSAKMGFNFLALLPQSQKTVQTLSLSYAPDWVRYNELSAEDYTAHRFTAALKAKSGAVSFSVDNALVYIGGDANGPIYSTTLHDDQRSAYATAAPRERRRQLQDRAKAVLQYDQGKWFVRGVGNLILYDLMTNLATTAGCQNYADRFDLNGGGDFGYKVLPKTALTLNYRYGREYQQQFPTAIDKTHTSATSDYQRLLIGIEGKPAEWITLALQVGPDWRRYPATTAVHTTPMAHLHPRKYYGEATATIAPTKTDSIDLKGKQWVWVSSTGKVPYIESTYELAYRHKFAPQLSLDLGLKYGQSNYTIATGTSALRNDKLYAGSGGVSYAFTPHWSATVVYVAELGRNGEAGLGQLSPAIDPAWREFNHHVVSGTVGYKF